MNTTCTLIRPFRSAQHGNPVVLERSAYAFKPPVFFLQSPSFHDREWRLLLAPPHKKERKKEAGMSTIRAGKTFVLLCSLHVRAWTFLYQNFFSYSEPNERTNFFWRLLSVSSLPDPIRRSEQTGAGFQMCPQFKVSKVLLNVYDDR